MREQLAGIYVHIPFCVKKCGYCDFYSITRLDSIDEFVSALVTEIQLTAPAYDSLCFDTIYMGGGTPSLLNDSHLQTIWDSLHHHFHIQPEGEFTIEANPGILDLAKLSFLWKLGFNRLSLGAQSFHQSDLSFLERIHSVDDIINNFEASRWAGFENINIDLMTAFPHLSKDRFRYSLEQVIALGPEHVSCYTLILEPNTKFYRRFEKGEFTPFNSDQEADFYEMTIQILDHAGFPAYEISNFAREMRWQCQHNMKYWKHVPYIGFGPSAHSFQSPERWRNVRTLAAYVNNLNQGKLPVAQREKLTGQTLEFEYIFLHLRLRDGLNKLEYQQRFHKDFAETYTGKLKPFFSSGLMEQEGDFVRLSKRGWLLADEIVSSI